MLLDNAIFLVFIVNIFSSINSVIVHIILKSDSVGLDSWNQKEGRRQLEWKWF